MKWHTHPRKGDKEKRLMPKKKTGRIKKREGRSDDPDEWLEHAIELRPDVFAVPTEKSRVGALRKWHPELMINGNGAGT